MSDGIGQGPRGDTAAGLSWKKAFILGTLVSTLWGREGRERGVKGSEEGPSAALDGRTGPICRGLGAEGQPRGPGVHGRVLPSMSSLGHVCGICGLGSAARKKSRTQTENLQTHGGPGHLCSHATLALRPLGPHDAVLGFPKLRQLRPALPGKWILGYEDPRVTKLTTEQSSTVSLYLVWFMSYDISSLRPQLGGGGGGSVWQGPLFLLTE